MLGVRDMSGYDMKRNFETYMSSFWSESYGQIYPVLKTLLAEEKARSEIQKTAGKPDRSVYALTEAGRAELQDWLQQPADTEIERNETVLKVLFGNHAETQVTIAHLEKFISLRQAMLDGSALYKNYAQTDLNEEPATPYVLMATAYVTAMNQAALTWAESCIGELRKMEEKVAVVKRIDTVKKSSKKTVKPDLSGNS